MDTPRMPTVADFDTALAAEFGPRLAEHGFLQTTRRTWVRETKLPIREILAIQALKGATYSPLWGVSIGLAPSFRGGKFRKQTSSKNAVMDLRIDPIDETGNVPREAIQFLTGYTDPVPIRAIRECADTFVPRALADFARVTDLPSFCAFFRARSRLVYRRFGFLNVIQHGLVMAFVAALEGDHAASSAALRDFCERFDADPDDPVLRAALARVGDSGPGA